MLDLSRRKVLLGLLAAPIICAYPNLMKVNPRLASYAAAPGDLWRVDGIIWSGPTPRVYNPGETIDVFFSQEASRCYRTGIKEVRHLTRKLDASFGALMESGDFVHVVDDIVRPHSPYWYKDHYKDHGLVVHLRGEI